MFGEGGGRRLTKAEQLEGSGIGTDNPRVRKSRIVGHNRTEIEWEDGTRTFILHETRVAEWDPRNRMAHLWDGGWKTMTTRRAMSQALKRWGLAASVYGGSHRGADHVLIRQNGEETPFTGRAHFHFPKEE